MSLDVVIAVEYGATLGSGGVAMHAGWYEGVWQRVAAVAAVAFHRGEGVCVPYLACAVGAGVNLPCGLRPAVLNKLGHGVEVDPDMRLQAIHGLLPRVGSFAGAFRVTRVKNDQVSVEHAPAAIYCTNCGTTKLPRDECLVP